MVTRNCKKCIKEFQTKQSQIDRGYGNYCSRVCHGLSQRGRTSWNKGGTSWMKGKKWSPETLKKNSEAHKGVKSFLWKGGVSEKNRTLRQNIMATTEYRQWRTAVFERDSYSCQECGARNGKGKAVVFNADHIEAFALILQKHGIDSVQGALICADLWSVSNGRTLCVPCHVETPNFGIKTAIKQTV